MADENRIGYLETVHENLRVIKRAHAFAMERKKRFRLWFGIASATLSLLVASGLVEILLGEGSKNTVATVKIATFLAAMLTSALTLLNYEKEAEAHVAALEVYSNLARDCGLLVARLRDGAVVPENIDAEITVIDTAYDKANQDFKSTPPWNRDYARATAQVVAKDAKALAGESK